MSNHWRIIGLAALVAAGAGCSGGRYSKSAFSLPPDGNAENGKRAFLELGCPSCHILAGEQPGPALQSAGMVMLGGEVEKGLSDAYLFTSIVYPSHELAPLPKDRITTGGISRMPSFADRMTVRQAIDTVAYLQSRYTVRQRLPAYSYRYLSMLPPDAAARR